LLLFLKDPQPGLDNLGCNNGFYGTPPGWLNREHTVEVNSLQVRSKKRNSGWIHLKSSQPQRFEPSDHQNQLLNEKLSRGRATREQGLPLDARVCTSRPSVRYTIRVWLLRGIVACVRAFRSPSFLIPCSAGSGARLHCFGDIFFQNL
jgi:hypothetical protein